MRVLHVIPSLAAVHGGPSQAITMFEKACRLHAISIDVVTTDDDGPGKRKKMIEPGNIEENISGRFYFRKNTEFYKVSLPLANWLWRNIGNYDVVHIHALFSFTSMISAMIARMKKVPYVIRPLGTLNHYGRQQRRPWLKSLSIKCIEGPVLKHAAAVHFTSNIERIEAESLGIPIQSVILPLAVDPVEATDKMALVKDFPVLSDKPYVLFMSRLDPKKNIEGLLQAIKRLKPDCGNEFLCVIAGDGLPSYVASLKKLANELGVEEHIIWTGHLAAEQKSAALAGAAIFILPSYSENFGIAAAEALSAGVPSVLGEGVALAEDAALASAAIIVTTEPDSIAAALKQLMRDSELRESMAQRARQYAHQNYSLASMGLGLQKLYHDTLNKNSSKVRQ